MAEQQHTDQTEALYAYRNWDPGEKISSPGSARHTLRVRNTSGAAGNYSLKIGTGSNKHYRIAKNQTDEYDVGGNSFTGTNDGTVMLEWQRS